MRIEYDVGVDDVVAFNLHVLAQSSKGWACRLTSGFVVAGFALAGWLARSDPPPKWLNAFIGAALGAGVVAGIRVLRRSRVASCARRRHAGTSSGVLGRHELEIQDGWLHERTAVNRSSYDASTIGPVVSSSDHVFIFVGPGLAHIVPRHGVVEGDVDAFVRDLENVLA